MDFEVVVGDPWSMDVELLSELFSEWLAGGTPEEAARARLKALRNQAAEQLRQLAVLADDQRALVQPSMPTLQENMPEAGQYENEESELQEEAADGDRLEATIEVAANKAARTAAVIASSSSSSSVVAPATSAEAALQAWVSSGEVSTEGE